MSETPGLVPRRDTMLRPVASADEVIAVQKETRELVKAALQEGRDYGTIPGTDRATLLKPGAELLCASFAVVPHYTIIESEVDHDRVNTFEAATWITQEKRPSNEEADRLKAAKLGRWKKTSDGWVWQLKEAEVGESRGLYRYVIQCDLKTRDGDKIVGTGVGACSTMETKYIRNPRDFENTAIKMSQKRSLVAAALHAFSLSDQFTQDIEDLEDIAHDIGPAKRDVPQTAPPPPSKPREIPKERKGPAAFGIQTELMPATGAFTKKMGDTQIKVLKDLVLESGLDYDDLHGIVKQLFEGEFTRDAFQWSQAVGSLLINWFQIVKAEYGLSKARDIIEGTLSPKPPTDEPAEAVVVEEAPNAEEGEDGSTSQD